MHVCLKRRLVFGAVFDRIPVIVYLVVEERCKYLSFEELVIEILERLLVNLYAFILNLKKVFCVSKNNMQSIFLFLN
jgi:hypothetical protein